ncbi:histone [Podarcis lilfordi]|uniref:Histone n=1 Tax=Podarcis lilfordi TaxID=74358 RepID=A0AA35KDR5_9SAUR|nr:histone [Podarcis lilfordi]
MAATTRRTRKKSQVHRRPRYRTQYRQRRPRGGKIPGRRAKHGHGKKLPDRRPSKKAQKLRLDSVRMTNEAQNILHFCVHDLYKKVSLAAERLRKKKRHVSITVSDVRNALKKIMPRKYDRKSVSSISCKCR